MAFLVGDCNLPALKELHGRPWVYVAWYKAGEVW